MFLFQGQHEKFKREDRILMLQALFKNVHCQANIMSDRQTIFHILKYNIQEKSSSMNVF